MSDLSMFDVAPFRALADCMGDLRDRFLKELKTDEPHQPPSPHLSEFTGTLAALITTLNHLNTRLQGLERHDKPAYEAFIRAMEGAPE